MPTINRCLMPKSARLAMFWITLATSVSARPVAQTLKGGKGEGGGGDESAEERKVNQYAASSAQGVGQKRSKSTNVKGTTPPHKKKHTHPHKSRATVPVA